MKTGHPNFDSFWAIYLNEHSNSHNRALHVVGTTAAFILAIGALVAGMPLVLLLVPVVGFGMSWFGHFFVERNKPTAFRHPLWSIRADFKMTWMALTGQLQSELQRVQSLMLLVSTMLLPLTDVC